MPDNKRTQKGNCSKTHNQKREQLRKERSGMHKNIWWHLCNFGGHFLEREIVQCCWGIKMNTRLTCCCQYLAEQGQMILGMIVIEFVPCRRKQELRRVFLSIVNTLFNEDNETLEAKTVDFYITFCQVIRARVLKSVKCWALFNYIVG